jgi:hypothetical protein
MGEIVKSKLLACGILAGPLFVAVGLLQPLVRDVPDRSMWRSSAPWTTDLGRKESVDVPRRPAR